MKQYKNIDLYRYSTMRTHSIGRVLFVPESKDELRLLILSLKEEKKDFYILSGGSNTVFADVVETVLISLEKLNTNISIEGKSVVVGCSVRIQKLINYLSEHDLGGIEYLYTLPALIGGIIYMNAGRGKVYNKSISDFLQEVEVYNAESDKFETIRVQKADFSYRKSPFQNSKYLILGAKFIFLNQDSSVTKAKIAERLNISKKNLSADKPSCGSVFCVGNRFLYRLIKGMRIGGAMFSKKTSNWISNVNNASGSDVIRLIEKAEKIHNLFLQKYKVEIRIVK